MQVCTSLQTVHKITVIILIITAIWITYDLLLGSKIWFEDTRTYKQNTDLQLTQPVALCIHLLQICILHDTHTNTHLTALDFTEARDSEWQWHQLSHMQVCNSLQTDNHASTSSLSFYRLDALPATQPTASKHWRHYYMKHTNTHLHKVPFCTGTFINNNRNYYYDY